MFRGTNPPIPIRWHTFFCLTSFAGAGYSDVFVRAMHEIVDRIGSGQHVKPVVGKDFACASCPGQHNGLCPEEGMQEMDRQAIKVFGMIFPGHRFKTGVPFAFTPQMVVAIRHARLRRSYIFSELCGHCTWRGRCTKIANSLFYNAKLFQPIRRVIPTIHSLDIHRRF